MVHQLFPELIHQQADRRLDGVAAEKIGERAGFVKDDGPLIDAHNQHVDVPLGIRQHLLGPELAFLGEGFVVRLGDAQPDVALQIGDDYRHIFIIGYVQQPVLDKDALGACERIAAPVGELKAVEGFDQPEALIQDHDAVVPGVQDENGAVLADKKILRGEEPRGASGVAVIDVGGEIPHLRGDRHVPFVVAVAGVRDGFGRGAQQECSCQQQGQEQRQRLASCHAHPSFLSLHAGIRHGFQHTAL